MNNPSPYHKQIERHLALWIYLLPVVGVVPAIWTLYRLQNKNYPCLEADREQKKASRLSLNLALIWLISYSMLSFGASSASEIMSFRLLYANAILTTAYFVSCTVLMSRLGRKKQSGVKVVEHTS